MDNFRVEKGAFYFVDPRTANSQVEPLVEHMALNKQKADLQSKKFQIIKFPALKNPDIKPEESTRNINLGPRMGGGGGGSEPSMKEAPTEEPAE